ncbi:hypothetical protein SAMN05444166_8049 [Singulisphaera sp. GP187]|nr:hypothetical protein SAMN05444166_8049 [Singulisphaera sp. GP187]
MNPRPPAVEELAASISNLARRAAAEDSFMNGCSRVASLRFHYAAMPSKSSSRAAIETARESGPV